MIQKDKEREIPIESGDTEEEKNTAEKENETEKESQAESEEKEEQEKIEEETAESTEESAEALGDEKIAKERYLRLLAEFTNYKKRAAQQKEQLLDLARANIIQKLLPVVDDFERLMQHIDHDNKDGIIEGVQGIHRKMVNAFQNEGLERIDALEQPFDPNFHDAMMVQPVDAEEKDDTVIQVYEEGYLLNGKILRPAKVIVGKYQD